MSRTKRVICLMMCLVLMLGTIGCGDSSDGKSVDMTTLQNDLPALDDELPEMTTVTDQSSDAEASFSVLADFDYAKVDHFFYSYSKSGSPEEIAVISVKDKLDVTDLMKALQNHIDSRTATFQQYSPEQVQMVESSILTYEGTYVLYAVSKKNGLMQDKFKEIMGG